MGVRLISPHLQFRRTPNGRHKACKWNLCAEPALVIFDRGWGFEVGRSEMSLPNDTKTDDKEQGDNVIRLGTETLFAIADQLRQMYDADLRTKPSEELERLMQRIERGEDVR